MKRSVKDLIQQRNLHKFMSVTPDVTLFEALKILDQNKLSALLVIENDKFCGIFSEKDFVRNCISKGIQLFEPVSTVMTTEVYYVEPTFNLEECLQIMSKFHIRHLPVLENGKPISLISMRHIMEVLVDDKDIHIRELTTYITGTSPILTNSFKSTPVKAPLYSARPSSIAV